MLAVFVSSLKGRLITKNKSFCAAGCNELESYSEEVAVANSHSLWTDRVGHLQQLWELLNCLTIAQCIVEIFMEGSFKERLEELEGHCFFMWLMSLTNKF